MNRTTPHTPDTFDLAGWLAGTDQDDLSDRSHQTVTVYRHPGQVDAALGRVAELEAGHTPTPSVAGEEAIGEARQPATTEALDEARAAASALIDANRLDVTVYAIDATEAATATEGHDRGTPGYAYHLFSAACRLPGNVKASPAQWEQIRHAIGPAQWTRIDRTLGAVMTHDTAQVVDAVFSSGS